VQLFVTAAKLEQKPPEEQYAQDDGDGDDDDLDETHGLILKVKAASNPKRESRIVSAQRELCQQ
jgi:hypothetical protein